jgi:ATPase subunit of ABC transporter with duplicated ATPase domains
LEQFLDHFGGVVVVVSHDRYFLDRTVDFLAAFEDGRFSSRYPGPFSNYLHQRQADQDPQTRPRPQALPQIPISQSPIPKANMERAAGIGEAKRPY